MDLYEKTCDSNSVLQSFLLFLQDLFLACHVLKTLVQRFVLKIIRNFLLVISYGTSWILAS